MDLVLFALLFCEGDQRFVPTDEVALGAFRLFRGKFCWDTLVHLPHWDRVRQWLSEAKKEKHGVLVEGFSGDRREGWRLTAAGIRRLKFKRPMLASLEVDAAPEESYSSVPPADLVAYAALELEKRQKRATLPILTEICVRRFPLVFELMGFAGWPDSAAVMEAMEKARSAGLLATNAEAGSLSVTEAGRLAATELARKVGQNAVTTRLEDVGRGLTHRAARNIDELERTTAWQAFKSGRSFSDAAACEALQCSLQSHPKALRRALDRIRAAADELSREDVASFIRSCATILHLDVNEPA